MSKVKPVVVACLAVLALSAVAAASASAAWMESGATFGTGSKAALNSKSIKTENAVLVGAQITIECSGALEGAGAEIIGPNKGAATRLVFTTCESKTENCTLEGTTVSTVPILAEATLAGGAEVSVLFLPETKNTFSTFKINGAACAASGINAVTGHAKVLAPTGQTEKTEQEIKAVTTANGELKLGSGAASLSGGALIKLVSGKPWSFL